MTQATPLTFAIPFYSNNKVTGELYLRKAIDSVLRQDRTDWKLILVDDKSPIPGVREIIDSYADARMSYHLNDVNKGQAGNWNQCVKLIDTPYYTILHADDELLPNYASVMLKALEANPHTAAVFCQTKVIDENDTEVFSFVDFVKTFIRESGTYQLDGEEGVCALLKGNFIMCPSVCYRHAMTKDLQFKEDGQWKYIPDLYFWIHMLLNDRRLTGVPDVAFRYRRHSESGTDIVRKTTKIFEEESSFYDFVRSECQTRGWSKAARLAERKTIIKLRAAYFSLMDVKGLRLKAAKDKIQLLANL